MSTRLVSTLLALGVLAPACGGGGDTGEPLLASALTGEYDGQAFTPEFGFVALRNGVGLIAVGDGPIHCGTETAAEPPTGTNAIFSVPLVEGAHGTVSVQMIQNIDSYMGVGANTGSVTLTAVSDASVAGTVAFDYTDSQARHFAINGSFEALRCAP